MKQLTKQEIRNQIHDAKRKNIDNKLDINEITENIYNFINADESENEEPERKKLIEIYIDKNDKMQISWFRISRHQCLGILKQWSDNMIINNYIKDKEEKIKTIKGDDAQLNKLKVAR